MKPSIIEHFRRSIFLKFLLVIKITGLLVILPILIFFHFWFHNQPENPFFKNASHYIDYFIAELGPTPSLDRAQAFASKYFWAIRYEGSDQQWATTPSMPTFQKVEQILHDSKSPKKYHFFIRPGAKGKFLFIPTFKPIFTFKDELHIIFLLLAIILVFLGALYAIAHILKPIRYLEEGVKQIQQGNLNYTISVCKRDELGQLAVSFNQMTQRIREMISAKEQLLLDVSHEFRTPLTRIQLSLALMSKSKQRDSIQADIVELNQMLDEILESGRLNSAHGGLNRQTLKIAQFITDIVSTYKLRKPKLILDLVKIKDLELSLDRERIKKVVSNILENAYKYSSDHRKPINIMARLENEWVIITIRDHGCGIPTQELSKIFEPFYRVDRSRSKDTGGFGLGLSLCKRILEAHGGKIQIQSNLKEGTTVDLFFPNQPLKSV